MARLAKQVRNREAISDVDYIRYHRGITALKEKIDFETAPDYRQVRGTVIWGDPRAGKDSLAADESTLKGERYYRVHAVEEGEQVWFNMYDGEENIIISDFYGQISIPKLLRFLDGHKEMIPIKGGFTMARWTKVWITSNVDPKCWWPHKTGTPQYEALFSDRITEIIHMEADEETKALVERAVEIDAKKDSKLMSKYEGALKLAKERRKARADAKNNA